jgi:SHS2 domain-containing protein
MVQNLDEVAPLEKRLFQVRSDALDMLLFELLQELIYHKDAQELLLRIPAATIERNPGGFTLTATARGERISPAKHQLIVDVKAVTLHRFVVEQTGDGWHAFVILDI